MTNTFIMIGLQGSGKSTIAQTIAKNQNAVIISSDKIREKFFGSENDQKHNKQVFKLLYEIMEQTLQNNQNVIIDATNIDKATRQKIFNVANKYDTEVIAVDVKTSVAQCIKNNENRSRKVPTAVIERYSKKYEKPTFEEGFEYIFEVKSNF